jgi:hypothetical protein
MDSFHFYICTYERPLLLIRTPLIHKPIRISNEDSFKPNYIFEVNKETYSSTKRQEYVTLRNFVSNPAGFELNE